MMNADFYSEIFGASEDEAPELDHTQDSENGKSSFTGPLVNSN
jgi:hypothetical protein